MKTICTAVDFHVATDAVVAHAAALARALGAEVELTHVHKRVESADFEEVNREEVAAIEERLAVVAAAVPPDVRVRTRVEAVPVSRTFADGVVAAAASADLLVMGQTESRGLWRWFEGDTTAGVLDAVACPVLVVPAGMAFAQPTSITLAVDARPVAQAHLDVLARLARAFGASIDVFVDATREMVGVQRDELDRAFGELPHTYTAATPEGHAHAAEYLLARTKTVGSSWLCLRHGRRAEWQRRARRDLGARMAEVAPTPTLILNDAPASRPPAPGLVAERSGGLGRRFARELGAHK